jgi:hypothetical protein
MTDDEIRAVVRQVLAARNLQPSERHVPGPHPSHVRLSMVVPTAPGSPCVIEPNVGCNQCGYCVSAGH